MMGSLSVSVVPILPVSTVSAICCKYLLNEIKYLGRDDMRKEKK